MAVEPHASEIILTEQGFHSRTVSDRYAAAVIYAVALPCNEPETQCEVAVVQMTIRLLRRESEDCDGMLSKAVQRTVSLEST